MSDSVRDGLASQFGVWDHADVCVRFHLERSPDEQQQEERQADRACASAMQFVGDPLPAHTVILILASPVLKIRLGKACWKRSAAGARTQDGVAASGTVDGHPDKGRSVKGAASGPEGGCERGAVSALPEVLVPLSSEAEVSFARQAIEYIYTGSLSADLGFEALLRVRQQACYLGIEHCPHACDQAMLAWLQAREGQGQQQGQQQQQDGAGSSTGTEAAPAVLQAYACHALFPEPGTGGDPASFQPVRSTLSKQLVSHFGDAVAALTRRDLCKQMLQLPAVAVGELLAADDFGSDSEDSVLMLLACWLFYQKGEEGKEEGASEQTRAELCGLVRLHRLGSTYLHHVLPVYEPFTISRAELGFLQQYVGADAKEKEDMLNGAPQRRLSPWYCSPARRQVVPEEGRTVEWSVNWDMLLQGLRGMMGSKKTVRAVASFGTFAAAFTSTYPAYNFREACCGGSASAWIGL